MDFSNYFPLLVSLPVKNFAETFQLITSAVMEQHTKGETTSSMTSPSKTLKHHHSTTDTPALDDNNQRVVIASD